MEDKRFIVWLYHDDPVADEETYDSDDSFDERAEAEAAALKFIRSGVFKTAILTDENWIELDRWTMKDID